MTDQTKQDELCNYLSDLSEEYRSAGWLIDWEYMSWLALWGKHYTCTFQAKDIATLGALANDAGGWAWMPDDALEPIFIPWDKWIEEWERHTMRQIYETGPSPEDRKKQFSTLEAAASTPTQDECDHYWGAADDAGVNLCERCGATQVGNADLPFKVEVEGTPRGMEAWRIAELALSGDGDHTEAVSFAILNGVPEPAQDNAADCGCHTVLGKGLMMCPDHVDAAIHKQFQRLIPVILTWKENMPTEVELEQARGDLKAAGITPEYLAKLMGEDET